MTGADYVHISRLAPHPANVREDLGDLTELAASIREHGILQPIVVAPKPTGGGQFLILAGHRRYAAARKAGLQEVPVTVRQPGDSAKVIELMLVENLQRADLNPMDKAEAMGKLRDRGYTALQIAQAISVSDATVYQFLSLLELDKPSRDKIRQGEITKSDAVQAITRHRARVRKRSGQRDRGAAVAGTWEPDHFTSQHPLARKAAAMCAAREHNLRRRVGKIACGQSWETVIRADERTTTAVLAQVEDRGPRATGGHAA
jgi:ParB family chromosome partitioning protein